MERGEGDLRSGTQRFPPSPSLAPHRAGAQIGVSLSATAILTLADAFRVTLATRIAGSGPFVGTRAGERQLAAYTIAFFAETADFRPLAPEWPINGLRSAGNLGCASHLSYTFMDDG